MRTIKVNLEDGSSYLTSINGTNEEISQYFVGQTLNVGNGPEDRLVKCKSIEFLDKETA